LHIKNPSLIRIKVLKIVFLKKNFRLNKMQYKSFFVPFIVNIGCPKKHYKWDKKYAKLIKKEFSKKIQMVFFFPKILVRGGK